MVEWFFFQFLFWEGQGFGKGGVFFSFLDEQRSWGILEMLEVFSLFPAQSVTPPIFGSRPFAPGINDGVSFASHKTKGVKNQIFDVSSHYILNFLLAETPLP